MVHLDSFALPKHPMPKFYDLAGRFPTTCYAYPIGIHSMLIRRVQRSETCYIVPYCSYRYLLVCLFPTSNTEVLLSQDLDLHRHLGKFELLYG